RVDSEAGDAGLIGRPLPWLHRASAAARSRPAAARAACRGLRLAFGWRRRHVFQAEEHAGRQLDPVRHQPVAAVALCPQRRRTRDERGSDEQAENSSFHEWLQVTRTKNVERRTTNEERRTKNEE